MTKKKTPEHAAPTLAIKAFNKDLTCRDFQFAEGGTYKHDGSVVACGSGFHSIIGHPLAVLKYYGPSSRFFRVEISGQTHTDDGEKVASEILKIGDEIGLKGLITDAVQWVRDRATLEEGGQASGPRGAAQASGPRGAAQASGYQGAAQASGEQGAAQASGYQGAAQASGYQGKVKAIEGCALFAVERAYSTGRIISVACGIVGEEGILPDTWYSCIGGELAPSPF